MTTRLSGEVTALGITGGVAVTGSSEFTNVLTVSSVAGMLNVSDEVVESSVFMAGVGTCG